MNVSVKLAQSPGPKYLRLGDSILEALFCYAAHYCSIHDQLELTCAV